MTATASNGHGKLESLPELPSAESTRRGAQARGSVPDPTAEVTHSDSARLPRFSAPAMRTALTGGSVLHSPPLSIAQTWAAHRQAASHYNAWLMSGPRLAWGAVHTAFTALSYGAGWVCASPPRFVVAAAVAAAFWFWS
jgi:hypothetical protein